MTKVTILGEKPQEKELKKIEFVYYLNEQLKELRGNDHSKSLSPNDYSNIELISRNFMFGLDLMFAYQNDRNEWKNSNIYLGHFNDGIV